MFYEIKCFQEYRLLFLSRKEQYYQERTRQFREGNQFRAQLALGRADAYNK